MTIYGIREGKNKEYISVYSATDDETAIRIYMGYMDIYEKKGTKTELCSIGIMDEITGKIYQFEGEIYKFEKEEIKKIMEGKEL